MSDQYPANSHAAAAQAKPRQKQQAIVSGVHIRKKPLASRIAERGSTIWSDIRFEVLIPYIRDMVADMFYAATDRAFYPDSAIRTRSGGGSRPGRGQSQHISASGYVVTDYASQYSPGAAPAQHGPPVGQKPFDFTVYTFDNYAAGREIIDRLRHIIHSYNRAAANDLYELLNMAPTPDHTGENWGWESLEALASADVKRVRGSGGQYYLDIPDPQPLKK